MACSLTSIRLALALLATQVASFAYADASPCAVLSQSEVGALLGVPVEAGVSIGSKICKWEGSGKSAGKRAFFSLLTPAAFSLGKTPVEGAEKPSLSGVGDEAFYKYFSPPRYEKIKVIDLDVKKGQTAFGIQVWGFAVDEGKDKAKSIAVAVLPKL
jgi:hypothetical protein